MNHLEQLVAEWHEYRGYRVVFQLVKAIAAPYRELRLLPRVQGSRAAGG